MTGHFVLPLDQAVLTKQNYWAEVKGIFKMPAPTLDEWWNIKCLLLKCKHFKFWQTIRCIKKNPAVIPQSLIGNHIKSILKRNWSEIHLASDLSLSHRSWPLKKVIHPSIHSLPATISGSRTQEQQFNQSCPDLYLHNHILQLFWWDTNQEM